MTRKLPYTIVRNNEPMNLDKKCFDYLIGIEQENQQLKEEVKLLNKRIELYKADINYYENKYGYLERNY